MEQKTLGQRLRIARRSKGWNQEELEAESGMKQSTISKIERGIQKTSTEVAILAHALDVSAVWLSDGIGTMCMATNAGTLHVTQKGEDDVMLYQYADPRCAISPNQGVSDKFLPTISVSKATLTELGISDTHCIGFIQTDDSGGATLAPNDQGIINTNERDPAEHNGRLFAIAVGDRAIVRRITVATLGGCQISSENPDKTRFPDESLNSDQMAQLTIIGRLCWSSGKK